VKFLAITLIVHAPDPPFPWAPVLPAATTS